MQKSREREIPRNMLVGKSVQKIRMAVLKEEEHNDKARVRTSTASILYYKQCNWEQRAIRTSQTQ